MKFKLLSALTIAGITFGGCNSNSKTENFTDSAMVDTILRADSVIIDTTPMQDTILIDPI
ncbi:MAG: hypothetical protein H7069_08905 [Phormidesmis sp. FL-bin-119]|nr:hypothetical protein [Pedobacter sp.]